MRYLFTALGLLAVTLTSCVSYSELLSSAKPPQPLQKPEVTRNCSFEVAPLVDERSKDLKGDKSQGWFAPVIPILLMGWGDEGPIFTDSDKEVPKTVVTVFKKHLEDTIAESGYFSNAGKAYVVTATLKQFYSVRWEKTESWFSAGASSEQVYKLWPLGYISIAVKVTDKLSGKMIGERLVTRSFLYTPDIFYDKTYNDIKLHLSGTTTADVTLEKVLGGDYGTPDYTIMPSLAQAAVGSIVMRDFLYELPVVLDEIVANDAPIAAGDGTSFTMGRLCDDYRFQEIAVVDIDSGKVVSSEIKRRIYPIVSAPGQWVVLPVAGGHWMSDDDYARLLRRLAGKFDLDLKSNLNVAVVDIKK
jgi:hypothetical protein